MRKVWILGLPHSGTTVFWRAWRKDERFLCFDEPLANLSGLPADCSKQTHAEFIQLFLEDPRSFWQRYVPMHPAQELDATFTSTQVAYLKYLLNQSDNVVIDETHLHLYLPALEQLTPDGYVIHLYRRASCFATSHLRPSWSRDTTLLRRTVRRLRHEYNKRVFWTRDDYLPGMCRGEVIGRHPSSKFGLMLSDAGYDAERIMKAPTVVRLLAYWHFHYHHIRQEGPATFGGRFCNLRYEDFANDPTGTMGALYSWTGIKRPENLHLPNVYTPKDPFQRQDARWREAALLAGFDERELDTLL